MRGSGGQIRSDDGGPDAFEVGKALERLRSDLDRGANDFGHIEVDAADLGLVLASAQGEPTEVRTCTYCFKNDTTMIDEDDDAICSDCALPYTSGLEQLLRSLGYNELALLDSMTQSELSARQRGA